MFPEECIICHSNKYKRNNITGKRSIVRLVKCELICGGQLLEAAKQKEDIALLQQIQGEDLVARELQYHRDCHRAYTRFLSKPCKPLTPIQSGYMNAFIVFSEETVKTSEILQYSVCGEANEYTNVKICNLCFFS